MLTATPRGRNQYSHFYKKEKLRCNKRWYGDLNMQPSGVPILTAEEWALNEHGGSFWALGLDRNAQTSDGGHVQIHKQRWCWSPRFHKDYKLSILSVNDKIIPSHFYIACFFFRIRDKIFLAPSAKKKKKNREGTSISQLWDKDSHFICSKYMNNNRRNSTPTSYFRELTWPSNWKKHKWKTIPNYPASSVSVVQCGEATCLVRSLLNAEVVIKAGTGKGEWPWTCAAWSPQSNCSQTWFQAHPKPSRPR